MLVYGCGKKEEVKETKEEKFCIDKDLKEKITIEPIQKTFCERIDKPYRKHYVCLLYTSPSPRDA